MEIIPTWEQVGHELLMALVDGFRLGMVVLLWWICREAARKPKGINPMFFAFAAPGCLALFLSASGWFEALTEGAGGFVRFYVLGLMGSLTGYEMGRSLRLQDWLRRQRGESGRASDAPHGFDDH